MWRRGASRDAHEPERSSVQGCPVAKRSFCYRGGLIRKNMGIPLGISSGSNTGSETAKSLLECKIVSHLNTSEDRMNRSSPIAISDLDK